MGLDLIFKKSTTKTSHVKLKIILVFNTIKAKFQKLIVMFVALDKQEKKNKGHLIRLLVRRRTTNKQS